MIFLAHRVAPFHPIRDFLQRTARVVPVHPALDELSPPFTSVKRGSDCREVAGGSCSSFDGACPALPWRGARRLARRRRGHEDAQPCPRRYAAGFFRSGPGRLVACRCRRRCGMRCPLTGRGVRRAARGRDPERRRRGRASTCRSTRQNRRRSRRNSRRGARPPSAPRPVRPAAGSGEAGRRSWVIAPPLLPALVLAGKFLPRPARPPSA